MEKIKNLIISIIKNTKISVSFLKTFSFPSNSYFHQSPRQIANFPIFQSSKKLLNIFLIFAMVLNVVIPKNQEIKNNFMAAINCVSEIAQTNFYDKYAETVVNVTNGIASNILSALNMAGLAGEKINKQSEDKKRDNKETTPVNTSCDNGIIIKNNIKNSSTQLNLLKTKIAGLAYSNVYNEANLYSDMGVVRTNGTTETGILFFILFAILVVRIKDTIAVLNNNNRIAFINRLG